MNLLAFPFYSSKSKQARFTVPGYSYCMPLFCPSNRLLPFQIAKPKDSRFIDCLKIYNADTEELAYTVMGNTFAYTYNSDGVTDYIQYYGGVLPLVMACGAYYIEVQGWYSEVFTVATDLTELLRIEWRNTQNVGAVLYQVGFMQRCYLEAETTEPTYKYEEEGEENGAGQFMPQKKTVKKTYQVEAGLLAPFLADALGALPLHDTINIGSYAGVKEVQAKPDYPEKTLGTLPVMQIEFLEAAPVVTKVCQEALTLTALDPGSYNPAGWLCGTGEEPDTTPDFRNTGNYRCVQA